MKVGVWIGKKQEVLYDSTTDEIVFRDLFTEVATIIRIPFRDVQRARDISFVGVTPSTRPDTTE
jgi:hypothetical protein